MRQRCGEAVNAALRTVTAMTKLGQPLGDVGRRRFVILDQQEFQVSGSFTMRPAPAPFV